jgi:uncharacterized membrane protein HdeD (DUF308 family)
MKQLLLGILSIVFGVLTLYMGVRDYTYKLLPEFLYFVFGAILILLGVYAISEFISYRKDSNE